MEMNALISKTKTKALKVAAKPLARTVKKSPTVHVTETTTDTVLRFKRDWHNFERHSDGIYLRENKKRLKPVCGYIEFTEHRSALASNKIDAVIRLRDYQNQWRELVVRRSELLSPSTRLINKLADVGLAIKEKSYALRALSGLYEICPPQKNVKTADIPGWHTVDPDGQHVYVTGSNRVIGTKQCNVEVVLDKVVSGGPTSGGSLAQWNKNVGALCRGNPALQFAVCASLASAIVGPSGSANPAFLIEASRTDKNLFMQVAESVTGDKAQLRCNGQNDVEAMAARCNDSLLLLDIGRHNQQDISAINSLVAGRAVSKSSERSFRGVVLACGDQNDSAQHLQSGSNAKLGQESVLLTIPVAADTFITKLNGQKSADALATLLRTNADRFFGTVCSQFISHVADNYEKLVSALPGQIERFAERLMSRTWQSDRTIGLQQSRQFALVAIAGEIAISNGILNWKPGDAKTAIETGFDLWVNGVRKSAALTDNEIFLRLQRFFQSSAGGKFVPLSEYDNTRSIAGFFSKVDGCECFCVFPAYFETVLCKGIGKTAAIRVLKSRNILILGNRATPTRQINIPLDAKGRDKPKVSFYVVRDDIIRC